MNFPDRAFRTLNAARHCLLHATEEAELLTEMCRVIVELGGYRMAWVGYAQHDERKTVRPVAHAGLDEGFLERPDISWADAKPGATAVAIRTGKPCLGRNILTDPSLSEWRDDALKRGYASVSSFPLHVDGEVLGNLTILAAEPDAFDQAEVELLSELVEDLAFGLKTLRTKRQLRHTERALRTLSAGNRTLLRVEKEQELLQEMCRVIVDQGGYRAAVVFYAEHDEEKTARAMAWVGAPDEQMRAHRSWADTSEGGNRAAGIAMRTGLPSVGRDMLTDPAYANIRGAVAELGFASNSAFPLHIDGEVIGCLSIVASEPDAFDRCEVRLLQEMADDLAFGIATLRMRLKHREAERTIERMAYSDGLTGMPNRTALHERLAIALGEAKHQHDPLALLLLKVGQFQEINDTLGYREGDQLVREMGCRLRLPFKADETVARIGEDEFAVVLPQAGAARAIQVAEQLVATLDAPVEFAGLSVDTHNFVGIALFPGHGTDPEALIRRAKVAAFQARRAASGYALYTGSVDQECTRRLALMGELRRAIERNELLLYYQPKVHFDSMQVCGAEALVRWRHPQHGMLSTGEFIKLAENSGLITPLTHWVLETAFRQSYAWHETGLDCPLSVNLSAHDLRNPRVLDHIKGLFATWGTPPEAIQFEVTESALMDDPVAALETLTRLKGLGVELFIDDFGIGYSSLGYLQKLPVDSIKIDQSFVGSMLNSNDSATIVRSTIDLGHNLNRQVVAEGVDNETVWGRLAALNCDAAQGYFIAEPIPAERFPDWGEHSGWSEFRSSHSPT